MNEFATWFEQTFIPQDVMGALGFIAGVLLVISFQLSNLERRRRREKSSQPAMSKPPEPIPPPVSDYLKKWK